MGGRLGSSVSAALLNTQQSIIIPRPSFLTPQTHHTSSSLPLIPPHPHPSSPLIPVTPHPSSPLIPITPHPSSPLIPQSSAFNPQILNSVLLFIFISVISVNLSPLSTLLSLSPFFSPYCFLLTLFSPKKCGTNMEVRSAWHRHEDLKNVKEVWWSGG